MRRLNFLKALVSLFLGTKLVTFLGLKNDPKRSSIREFKNREEGILALSREAIINDVRSGTEEKQLPMTSFKDLEKNDVWFYLDGDWKGFVLDTNGRIKG